MDQDNKLSGEAGKEAAEPHLYRIGDLWVEFEYLPNGKNLEDAFALMIEASL
ncbi:MAG: hypothetical protein ACOX6P_03670 [Candidatus Merdivicinus sp.]